MKSFKGRVIAGGRWEGEAVVSRAGVNTLATFQKSAMANKSEVIVSDQNNPDIYGKNITGKALCLPVTIGSTTGGLVIQTVCAMKINPACFLFSKHSGKDRRQTESGRGRHGHRAVTCAAARCSFRRSAPHI